MVLFLGSLFAADLTSLCSLVVPGFYIGYHLVPRIPEFSVQERLLASVVRGPSLLGHFHGQQNCIAHVTCVIGNYTVRSTMPNDTKMFASMMFGTTFVLRLHLFFE